MVFHDLVPEMSSEDQRYEVEEQLIFEVPVLNPMDDNTESCLNGLFPTEMELAQFSADVETLLGGGTDREFHAMEEIGFGEMLKIEKEEVKEEEEVATREVTGRIKEEKKEKVLMLRLDYETVISTWGSQGTPWTALKPSEIDLDMLCCQTNSMCESGGEAHHHNHFPGLGLHMREAGDGGREARVSRYREKRRTRLFSKKIRYEVRKLNAEKRPRMKGRFVKRSSIVAAH
ncbi:BnaA07g24620D [Brassica napus]|uniref:BnaA07g24620D protein n=1 Tax=Brassica napus TaxID=3708 RepID=A0A078F6V7_BRANA|nr:BnaA07g24620D [Brassica napus]